MSHLQVHAVPPRSSQSGVLATLALVSALVSACGGGSSGVTEAVAAVTEENTVQSKVSAGQTSTSTASTQSAWTACASDGGTCTFSGTRTVRLGVSTTDRFVDATHTGSVWCDISKFPSDPAPGVAKSCWVSGGATSTPQAAASSTPSAPVSSNTSTSSSTAATGSGSTTDTAAAGSATGAGPRVATLTASGKITATSGQVISGLKISNPGGNCVDIVGVSNVTVRDSEIGPCGGAAVNVTSGANNITVEHNAIHDVAHGVQATRASNVNTLFNTIRDIPGAAGQFRHAIEYSWMNGGTVEGNEMTGSFPNDVMSGFESSNLRFIGNTFDVSIAESTGASFTIGDSTTGNPGANNYIARNVVIRQQGGVPAGVFGSTANTVLENNCFTAGIQAYNFSGVFNGVTVRNNVINMGPSFVPDASIIAGWNTNIDSTNCNLVP